MLYSIQDKNELKGAKDTKVYDYVGFYKKDMLHTYTISDKGIPKARNRTNRYLKVANFKLEIHEFL